MTLIGCLLFLVAGASLRAGMISTEAALLIAAVGLVFVIIGVIKDKKNKTK